MKKSAKFPRLKAALLVTEEPPSLINFCLQRAKSLKVTR